MFTWQVKYSCWSLFAVLFSNSPILVASSSSSEKILCSSTRRHSIICLWTFAEASSCRTRRTRRRWLWLNLCSFSRRMLHWRSSWPHHKFYYLYTGSLQGNVSNVTTSHYLLVGMLTKPLDLGLFSLLSLMLCFHFFMCFQVALTSQCSHASASFLLQASLHSKQLPMNHTEQPLLGLDADLALWSQSPKQAGHHVFVNLNPDGLQVTGGLE